MSAEPSAVAAARALTDQLGAGRVLLPGPAYDRAVRIWNGAVEHRPALIVRCESSSDVQAAVRAARAHGLPLSVRGGGHDWAGRALRHEGLVIDLTGMRGVAVDPEARVAVFGGGATAADVAEAVAPHGLSPVTGTVGAVGLAGLTLGGGYGPLNGHAGLAADNLLGADLVLADGRAVSTDATREPELFWALRGGGGNFGVATALRTRLHPFATVLAGLVLFPWAQAASVLRGYAALTAGAPDELTAQFGVVPGPDGRPALFISPVWCGDPAEGEAVMAEVRRLGTPVVSQTARRSYRELLGLLDDQIVEGRRYALRTRSLAAVTPEFIEALMDAGEKLTSPLSGIYIHHFHGAAARVGPEDTAFGMRRDHFMVEIVPGWEQGDGSRHRAWADDVSSSLAPFALPGGYPNLLGPDAHDQIAHAYGPNAGRLRAVKERFDPDGVFSAIPLPGPAAPGR